MFDAIASLAVAQNMRDLYRLVRAGLCAHPCVCVCVWRGCCTRPSRLGDPPAAGATAHCGPWPTAAAAAPTPPCPPASHAACRAALQVLVDTPLAPYFSDNLTSEDLDEMNIEVGGRGGGDRGLLCVFVCVEKLHKAWASCAWEVCRRARPAAAAAAIYGQRTRPHACQHPHLQHLRLHWTRTCPLQHTTPLSTRPPGHAQHAVQGLPRRLCRLCARAGRHHRRRHGRAAVVRGGCGGGGRARAGRADPGRAERAQAGWWLVARDAAGKHTSVPGRTQAHAPPAALALSPAARTSPLHIPCAPTAPTAPCPRQADRRALNITLNSIGTELTRDDRRKLYANFGLLYPHGQARASWARGGGGGGGGRGVPGAPLGGAGPAPALPSCSVHRPSARRRAGQALMPPTCCIPADHHSLPAGGAGGGRGL